ncbi:DUF916 and DUF3324 domain-containing protein [Companilactobacillus metriopterae]|uniref:DUF916 and DUF3324 domain-containing protein n=1 Tax=Companilactobacillus metriopterae TaxID=1909267 RepID=UPI0013E93B8D|nr:DUF916 and DUF3324 domain-containing protein [Companilactobacillus metriopterae]
MKRKSLVLGILALFLGLGTIFGIQTVKAEEVSYNVSAEKADNQINPDVTYFDLLVDKGSSQELTIYIQNKSSSAKKYKVSVNRALTNRNGVIDYASHGTKLDSSTNFDIEKMVSKPQTVTVEANSTKQVKLQLNTPNEDFDGVILGGIRVEQENQNNTAKKSNSKQGATIVNKFAYVIGLQIRQNQNEVAPDLKMNKVGAQQFNYSNYITANLQNIKPTVVHKLEVNARITEKGKNATVLKAKKSNMSMAPNSNFDFPISTNGKAVKAGNYTIYVNAQSSDGQYKWSFKKDFVISNADANKLNNSAVDVKKGVNWFLIILIVFLLIIAGLLIYLYFNQRNKKHTRK